MSENIQSIANGTYVIGQTSATNFVGGPGIKVDSPSEGTVRISNDETVLWENSNGVKLKDGITLSESRLNFESIKITYVITADGAPTVLEIPMLGINRGSSFLHTLPGSLDNHSYNTAGYCLLWQVFFADCTDTYLKSNTSQFIGKMNFINGSTPGTWTQGANDNVPIVYKIVGINRISGGNA